MIQLDRKVFFAEVRKSLFWGKLTQSQVDGMNDLLDVWQERGSADPRHLGYAFATDYHETGTKMQPVREGFKASDKAARAWVQRHYGHKGTQWYCWPQGPHGHVYYGRGDVQLTWYDNYVRMGRILGLPLAEKPDMVLQSKVSKMILVEGMLNGASKDGDFTGKALEDYFNDDDDDPIEARRIVNGTDKAQQIANYYDDFMDAIDLALEAYEQADMFERNEIDDTGPAKLPAKSDGVTWGAVTTAIGGVGTAVASLADKLSGPAALVAVGIIVLGFALIVTGRKRILRETGE